ncbi:MAG: YraN family protein [Deltaproteobacteria bacterium]|nr:YraN family protein [Deltaproteobacteria bacterium]MBZ0219031.1 YraN family protein [Deltaproteobacteria bacterium]
MRKKAFGNAGEDEAVRFLEKKGYRVIERNFSCRYGEIDIIARDGGAMVFVEVKTRSGDAFGPAAASVDERKQRKMTIAAQFYLEKAGASDSEVRFDVVSIEKREGRFEIELIRDAFEAAEIGW